MANTLSAIENLPSADLSGSPLSIYVLIIFILRVSGGIKLYEKRGEGRVIEPLYWKKLNS
jgi:hypothetical protein